METVLPPLKAAAATVACSLSGVLPGSRKVCLELHELDSSLKTEEVIRPIFDALSPDRKDLVYGKIWELAKMEDPTISGDKWGENHAFDDIPRLAKALRRLGFFTNQQTDLHSITILSHAFGEGGIGSQYLSLGECLGRDPETGHIGYVNGMGMPNLEGVGYDAKRFSNLFCDGNNLHVVYHSTHQKVPIGDVWGFFFDAARMKAVDGGRYTQTSYLIAQQWIDFLNAHPNRNYLQIAHSEGAAHAHAALRLIKEAYPDLLPRLRVITCGPAFFIDPAIYPGIQALNFIKKEDFVVNPWGTGAEHIGKAPYIITVEHTTNDHIHDPFSEDFQKAVKPHIQEFMRTGNIL